MSTLSKIFVVINLVLAVAFATFALTLYSKRVHYYEDKVKAVRALTDEKKALEEAKAKVEAELATETEKRKTAEGKVTNLDNEVKKLGGSLEEAKVKEAEANSRATVAVESQKVLTEQVKDMRSELEKSRATAAKQEKAMAALRFNYAEIKKERDDLKNEVNKARMDLAELHRDHKRVSEELANAEYVIATLIKKKVNVYELVGSAARGTVPDVRTKVVDVRPATGHVALGAGKDSGIKEGFEFLIHRQDKYIAKVRVTTVWNNFSGGIIVERKEPIKPGDDAMTDTTP